MHTKSTISSLRHLILLFATMALLTSANQSFAHGSMSYPMSRGLNCFLDGGETFSPSNPACQAMQALHGNQPYNDWDMVNQLADGDHKAFVMDGELCSGSKEYFGGLDLVEDEYGNALDWQSFPLIADDNGNATFVFDATVPHDTAYFWFYLSKDSYDYTEPLRWDHLESDPFCESGPEASSGKIEFECEVPQKEGKYVVYMVWQRSDSPESFYACSDVLLGDDIQLPTPTPIPVKGECNAPEWRASQAYTGAGFLVVHNGYEYESSYYTQGDEPAPNEQYTAWKTVGECANMPEPTPTAIPTIPPTEAIPLPATETPEPVINTPEPITPTPDAPSTIKGDVNCDGRVSLVDAILIQRLNAVMIFLSDDCEEPSENLAVYETGCDYNGDGKCGLVDSIIILQCNAAIENPYCE